MVIKTTSDVIITHETDENNEKMIKFRKIMLEVVAVSKKIM